MLDFSTPQIASFVSSRKNFKTVAKIVGRRNLRKQLLVVAGKGLQADSLQQNLQNKPVGGEGTFLQTFLNNHVEQFSVPNFIGSFWKSWKESPGS